MRGLREERFGGNGRGVKNEGERWRGVNTVGGTCDKGEKKSTTGIGVSLTSDYRDKEESYRKIMFRHSRTHVGTHNAHALCTHEHTHASSLARSHTLMYYGSSFTQSYPLAR